MWDHDLKDVPNPDVDVATASSSSSSSSSSTLWLVSYLLLVILMERSTSLFHHLRPAGDSYSAFQQNGYFSWARKSVMFLRTWSSLHVPHQSPQPQAKDADTGIQHSRSTLKTTSSRDKACPITGTQHTQRPSDTSRLSGFGSSRLGVCRGVGGFRKISRRSRV